MGGGRKRRGKKGTEKKNKEENSPTTRRLDRTYHTSIANLDFDDLTVAALAPPILTADWNLGFLYSLVLRILYGVWMSEIVWIIEVSDIEVWIIKVASGLGVLCM